MNHIHRLLVVVVFAAASSLAGFSAQPEGDPPVRFLTEQTVLWQGRSGVVPFQVDETRDQAREWPAVVSGDGSLEALGPARVLAGESLGFIRVRGVHTGKSVLAVGTSQVSVAVRPMIAMAHVRRPEPVIVAPTRGSYVWGIFHVGVELPPGAANIDAIKIELEVPGLGRIPAVCEVEPDRGPERRVRFEVDATELAPGATTLRPHATLGGEQWSGVPIGLYILHPADSEIRKLELESVLELDRPEQFGARHPALAGDALASGGQAVIARNFEPLVLVPLHDLLESSEEGSWQVMVRMRGDLGAGAFPTVGLASKDPNNYLGSVRVIDRYWQRLPIGGPIQISAVEGPDQWLGLRHGNAVYAGRTERRELYLDCIELVRIEGASAVAPVGMESMDSMGPSPAANEKASEMGQMNDSINGTGIGSAHNGQPILPGDLWIGCHTLVDGLSMNGTLKVEGEASWSGAASLPAPLVELVVDGEALALSQTNEPIFRVAPSELGPGPHTLQLRATQPAGRYAETPVQHFTVPKGVPQRDERVEHRIATRNVAWTFENPGDNPSALAQPGRRMVASIELPSEWTGLFDLQVDARGTGGEPVPTVEVRIESIGDETTASLMENTLTIQNWWSERHLGEVELASGRKRMVVTLDPSPGQALSAGEIPPLHVRSFVFTGRSQGNDRTPPSVRIRYPAEGHTFAGTDAVVVEVLDDRRVESVELFIDGRPGAAFARVPEGAGFALIPLWGEALVPGKHSMFVRAIDRASHQCDSPEMAMEVLADPPAKPGRYRRALHLLDRMAYGPDRAELAELLVLGEEAWLKRALENQTGDQVARGLTRALLGDKIPYGASQLALHAALVSDNPVRSRFVFFVDNHFNTWSGETGVPSEWGDHQRYQELGLAPFGELLLAAATSPVMLVYLDQQESFRDRVNENFSRELLELHTVGVHASYNQEDVTALARLLTGLTVAEEGPPTGSGSYRSRVFRYAPDLATDAGADCMGMHFGSLAESRSGSDPNRMHRSGFARFEAIVQHLAAHPATAEHWSRKLAEFYVGVPAHGGLVEDLTQVFLSSGGDSRAMLRALVGHRAFWDSIEVPRVATPFDFAMRLGRATMPRHVRGHLDDFLKSSGMGLFDHEAPDGYSFEDRSWIDSNATLARWTVAQKFPWAMRTLAPEALRQDFGDGERAWRTRVIQHAAFALIGRPLGVASTVAANEFLQSMGAEPRWKRVDQLTVLMSRFPEASIR